MITTDQGFMVLGDPEGQGSMTCVGKGKLHNVQPSNKAKLYPWRELVAAGARKWLNETADVYEPVTLTLTWSVARPAGHWGTGRNADTLKPSAAPFPTFKGTGDIDKLARAVLDALTASERFHDDAQVTELHLYKRYAAARTRPGLIHPDPYDVLPVPGVVVRFHPHTED